VIAPTFAYDTTQVTSPAITGTFPVGPNANATACLNPAASATAGVANISPACRAFLSTQRAAVLAGGVVNNTTTGPLVDGDRRMVRQGSGRALPRGLQPAESPNFGNPSGARNSVNFLKVIAADTPRTRSLASA
jgi:surface antigen